MPETREELIDWFCEDNPQKRDREMVIWFVDQALGRRDPIGNTENE